MLLTCWHWPGLNLIMDRIRVHSMSKVCYSWLLEWPKLALTSISNWRSGIVKDTGLVIRDFVEVLRISRLPLTLDLVLSLPEGILDNKILIQSLIFIAGTLIGRMLQISCQISVRQNPSTQTFKYISLHFPRHSMLRDNRTKRHEEEELGNFCWDLTLFRLMLR